MGRTVTGSVPGWIRTAHQFLFARGIQASATKDRDKLAKQMKVYIDANGEETPEGHREVYFPEPLTIGGAAYRGLRNQRSQGAPLLDEERAEALLNELGLRDEVIKTVEVEVADWDQLYILNQQGRITDGQLDALFDTPDPTWSLVVIK